MNRFENNLESEDEKRRPAKPCSCVSVCASSRVAKDSSTNKYISLLEGSYWAEKMNNSSAGPSSKARAGSSQPSESTFKRKRGVFQKDLQHMMYGFGDDPNTVPVLVPVTPLPETVALVEDIVVEYVTDMVHKAQDTASKRGKLLIDDFTFLIRKDLPKLNRCSELLSMNEELKQARKAFEVDEEKLATIE
ncbi:unnamed protein product [Camellia sinensis]